MDDDVIEIPPPISLSYKHSKNKKKVVLPEVIDIDEGDSDDVVILEGMVDTKKRDKATKNNNGYDPAQQSFGSFPASSSKSSSNGPQDALIVGDTDPHFLYDNDIDKYMHDYCYDLMDFDEYVIQSHFDNMDIPAGVEASVSWFPDPINSIKKSDNESEKFSSTDQKQFNNMDLWSPKPAHVTNLLGSSSSSNSFTHQDSVTNVFAPEPSGPRWFPPSAKSKKKSVLSSIRSGNSQSLKNSQASSKVVGITANKYATSHPYKHTVASNIADASTWFPSAHDQVDTSSSNTYFPNSSSGMFGLTHPPEVGPAKFSIPKPKKFFPYETSFATSHDPFNEALRPPEEVVARTPKVVDKDEILRKLEQFKHFDTVEDYSDHHYTSKGSTVKQPPKTWAKRIQEEWKILEDNLPDAIYVRVYEARMDLLRAVIVGAAGTPYHDGLFFFDFFFPSGYPNCPPHVYYHSGGLRINPNLYNNGKVCLSLLGTWRGNPDENWVRGVSTVLQVLVSIQALILNQKPFFNEPGYELMMGTIDGERQSLQYNENTFLLSLKTMIYTIRSPPKHFENFVLGHFHRRAHDILTACKAYMNGAQVGCLVKGGVQDVDEGDKSNSQQFKGSIPAFVNMLVEEFSHNGIKDCEKYQMAVNAGNEQPQNFMSAHFFHGAAM